MTKLGAILGASALCALAVPASASQIELTIDVDGTTRTFTGSDFLVTPLNADINGVMLTVSAALSLSNPGRLQITSANVVNTNRFAVNYEAVLSANDYAGPVNSIGWTGSSTWNSLADTSPTTFTFNYWADPSNVLATNSTPNPGSTVVGSFTDTNTGSNQSFSQNGEGRFAATGPFSMTAEWGSTALASDATVVSSGQSMTASAAAIPESATWTLMGVGFALIGAAGWKNRRPATAALD